MIGLWCIQHLAEHLPYAPFDEEHALMPGAIEIGQAVNTRDRLHECSAPTVDNDQQFAMCFAGLGWHFKLYAVT